MLGEDGKRYVLAEARVAHYARELGEDPEVVSRHKGAELVGLSYTPPFDFFLGHPNAHVVLSADYVTTDSGTGIVHLAPAFGEEDMDVATANGIEVVQPLDRSPCPRLKRMDSPPPRGRNRSGRAAPRDRMATIVSSVRLRPVSSPCQATLSEPSR